MRNFTKLGIDLLGRTAGKVKTYCPNCHDTRHDRRDKSLSVDIDSGLFKCHYCDWHGRALDDREEIENEQRRLRREQKQQQMPMKGSHARPKYYPELVVGAAVNPTLAQLQAQDYLTRERGLQLEVLRSQRVAVDASQPAVLFNYFDRGQLINQKRRTLDKQFTLTAKAELIPYGIDNILRRDVCYITEGEFDALTLIQCGFPEAVSVPNGAQQNLNFLDRFMETHFEDKSRIVLCLDNDRKGKMLRDELIRRMGEERCRLVQWSQDCKDANEELTRHGPESVRRCVMEAQEIPLTGIQTVADVEADLDEIYRSGLRQGAPLGLFGLDDLITFETGRYMVVSGRPGDGKSEFVDEICMRLCWRHGWHVAYFTPENTPITYHLVKLVEKVTARRCRQDAPLTQERYEKAKQWLNERVCHLIPGCELISDDLLASESARLSTEDLTERFTLTAILEKARQAVIRRGVRIIVLDPLNNIEPDPQMTDLKWDRHVNAELRRFARKYRCLVILVAHPRKVNRATADNTRRRVEMNDINGSADFGNMSDYCICVDRDDDLQTVTIYVDKVKFKHLGSRGSWKAHYDQLSGRYVPCKLKAVNSLQDPPLGPVAGTTDTVCVCKGGKKFYKTIDWRGFNQSWTEDPA